MSKPVWSYHQKVLLRSAGLGSSSPDSSSSLSDADEDQSPGSRSNEMSKVSSLVRAMGPARSASSISGPSRSTKPMSKRATQAPLPTSLSEPPRCTDHQPMTSNGPSSQDPKAMIPMSSAARTATHAVANNTSVSVLDRAAKIAALKCSISDIGQSLESAMDAEPGHSDWEKIERLRLAWREFCAELAMI